MKFLGKRITVVTICELIGLFNIFLALTPTQPDFVV